jgi:hypothetical protein
MSLFQIAQLRSVPWLVRTIAALFITLALLFPGEGARAREITLLEMMHNCERLETYWRQNPPKPGSASIPDTPAAICYGHMVAYAGLGNMVEGPDCLKGVTGPTCRHALHICFPSPVLYEQILAVFLAYARTHVLQWHDALSFHFANALMSGFPCKGEDTTPTRK